MGTDALQAKVAAIAVQHADLAGEELLTLLEYEWERVGLAVADRGPARDYVRDVAMRVFRQANASAIRSRSSPRWPPTARSSGPLRVAWRPTGTPWSSDFWPRG